MASNAPTFDLSGLTIRQPRKEKASGTAGGTRLAVCPFTVVCDSREQLPYGFTGMADKTGAPLAVPTVVRGLPSGDYSIDGFEERIAIERKSLEDLVGSVTWGRARFEAEIQRLDDLAAGGRGFAAVVIEASWPEIMAPAEHRPGWENRTDPRSVEGTIVAWSIRYPRVHWWACGDRRGAERLTFHALRKFWEETIREKE